MDDEVAMRVIDRRADRQEQAEADLDSQLVLRRIGRDPGTVDVLHDDVREAAVGGPAIKQAADA